MISVNNLILLSEESLLWIYIGRVNSMEASMSFRSIKNDELPRGTKSTMWYRWGETRFHSDCGTEKELSETRLSLLGWPFMSCWKGGHLSPGGGGGMRALDLRPTGEGGGGGGGSGEVRAWDLRPTGGRGGGGCALVTHHGPMTGGVVSKRRTNALDAAPDAGQGIEKPDSPA